MEPDVGTDPDEFEIHISDDESHVQEKENNSPTVATDCKNPDLLRASLSDVVLTQSHHMSERRIEWQDGDENHAAKDLALDLDSTATPPDSVMASSPSMTQPLPVSALSQHNQTPLEDLAADFEDALDPPLLTSTLKAENEDSDDEFDFDLPNSKADKGKNVRFNAGSSDPEEPAKKVSEPTEKQNRTDRMEPSEKCLQNAEQPPSISTINMSGQGDGKSAIPKVDIESRDGSNQERGDAPDQGATVSIKHEKSEEENEDRRYIITSTAADWDNVQTVEAGFGDAGTGEGAEPMTTVPPLLSFSDLWQYFRKMDHSAVKEKIQVTSEKKGFGGLVSRLFGPPRLHKDLHPDRELVFCIAATTFDNAEEEHKQCLQTIYRVLTGSRFSCPRYGSHWEEIGFQGRDPATDLRGTGMLGLVQLVSFLQDDTTAQLGRDLYKLSLHPTQNFPFCVMCINISRIILQSLREGILNRECNSQKKVMPVVNQFYAGTLLYLYRVWQQGKTIKDSGFVIRDVENRAKKQWKQVFRDLQTYTAAHKASAEGAAFASADPRGSAKEDNVKFFSVVKSEAKTAAELY